MIGIYGGTFDPVHYGHLRTALEVKEIFSLTEIRLMPCAQPAHKSTPTSTPEQRLEMLVQATQGESGLVVDKCELDRLGTSYMVDTLHLIRNEIVNEPLLLFMGIDAFTKITSWQRWKSLFDYAHLVVMTRPNYQQPLLSQWLQLKLTATRGTLVNKAAGNLFFQSVTRLDISATTIRQLFTTGKTPRFLLPDNVINYIKQNKLYIP